MRRPILAFVLNALIVIAGMAGLLARGCGGTAGCGPAGGQRLDQLHGGRARDGGSRGDGGHRGAPCRVAGVRNISSTSSFGRSRVTIELDDGIDLDVAASDLRDAVSRVQNDLPDDADIPRVIKADADGEAVLRIAVTSSCRSAEDLTRLVEDMAESKLLSAPGVADLQIFGDRGLVFRVDVDAATGRARVDAGRSAAHWRRRPLMRRPAP